MKLHTHQKLFNQAIRATAQKMDIAEIYVEKDYWVTVALHHIFQSDIAGETIFKGGTALSKCFGIIKRFSEDIDLVMIRKDTDTNSSMDRKVKQPSKLLEAILPEENVEGLTNKLGMIRKTVHPYPKIFKGKFGQVRDHLVLESSYLGSYEPFHKHTLNSYVTEMMLEENQQELIEEYQMNSFEVNVMHIHRTLCEKIMSLVRFSYGEDAIQQLKNKVRHLYDIHQLLTLKDVKTYFESEDFITLLLQVKTDDRKSFKSNNDWMDNPLHEALIFSQTSKVWSQLKQSYMNDFAKLVYGDLPLETNIEQTIQVLTKRLQSIQQ